MTVREVTELLFVQGPPGRSDVAIVFGHHDPAVSARRARHAASLYLGQYTPRLILSGGVTGSTGTSEAEFMAGVVGTLGVPGDVLLLDTEARNTVENLRRSVGLLHWANLLPTVSAVHLVSCPWHMRRVSILARSLLPAGIRLLCSPHEECCTAATWASSPDCRDLVLAEAQLVWALVMGGEDGR